MIKYFEGYDLGKEELIELEKLLAVFNPNRIHEILNIVGSCQDCEEIDRNIYRLYLLISDLLEQYK